MLAKRAFICPSCVLQTYQNIIFVGIFWATLDLVCTEEGKMMNPADLEAENIQAFIANIVAFCIGGNTPNSSF